MKKESEGKMNIHQEYEAKVLKYQRDNAEREGTIKGLRLKIEDANREQSNANQLNYRKLEEVHEELKRLQALLKVKDEQIYNLEAKLRTCDFSSQEVTSLKRIVEGKDNEIMGLQG